MTTLMPEDRAKGALYGAAIGDALAMPVHWYYNRGALLRDYGTVDEFLRPKNPHPDSILWRSRYVPPNQEADILHDQAKWWGQREIHYHQFLEAGENTLTWKLANEVIASLNARGGQDSADYLARYICYLTTPGQHRDTYLEECHRGFFANYAKGIPPNRCAIKEKHIGGLAGLVPVVAWYRNDRELAVTKAKDQVATTHAGEAMAEAAALIADLLWQTLNGRPLAEAIAEVQSRQANRYARHPFGKWSLKPDESIIGPKLSSACYLEDSVPAVIFLALKYHDCPREGLIANTMLGGDNVHRGILLGALLGAEKGMSAWPKSWSSGLKQPPNDSLLSSD